MIASNARREPVAWIELETGRRRRATTSDGIVTCLLRIQPWPAWPGPRPVAEGLARPIRFGCSATDGRIILPRQLRARRSQRRASSS